MGAPTVVLTVVVVLILAFLMLKLGIGAYNALGDLLTPHSIEVYKRVYYDVYGSWCNASEPQEEWHEYGDHNAVSDTCTLCKRKFCLGWHGVEFEKPEELALLLIRTETGEDHNLYSLNVNVSLDDKEEELHCWNCYYFKEFKPGTKISMIKFKFNGKMKKFVISGFKKYLGTEKKPGFVYMKDSACKAERGVPGCGWCTIDGGRCINEQRISYPKGAKNVRFLLINVSVSHPTAEMMVPVDVYVNDTKLKRFICRSSLYLGTPNYCLFAYNFANDPEYLTKGLPNIKEVKVVTGTAFMIPYFHVTLWQRGAKAPRLIV
jgi:hypothetical protein